MQVHVSKVNMFHIRTSYITWGLSTAPVFTMVAALKFLNDVGLQFLLP